MPLRPRPRAAPAIPPGERVYAIGDVHGRLDLLDRLLATIADDAAARGGAPATLIFLGDYVDRGPDSRGVIERLIALGDGDRPARFLLGNHEEIFRLLLDGEPRATRLFLQIGGIETLRSYGLQADDWRGDPAALADRAAAAVPASHRRFLDRCEDRIALGDYRFVHAGIRPRTPFERQTVADLRWIREDFLDSRHDHGAIIVHGHTISEAVEELPNRIGIDTGAFATGRLTALGLEGTKRWYLTT